MNWTFPRWPVACLAGSLLVLASQLPTGTASAEVPRDSAATVELGRMLFFDPKLSGDKWVSCASCHQPGLVFSDGLRHATGVRDRKGVRNTPSLLDVGQQRRMFWDGRRASLEQQALDPLLNSAEHGLVNNAELLDKLRADPRYPAAFESAYAVNMGNVTVDHVAQALAAFQRTLVSGTTPFDRFLAGQSDAMTPAAQRGWAVFDRQAQCTRCHVVEAPRPLLTDHQFHALPLKLQRFAPRFAALRFRVAELHRDGLMFNDKVLADPDISALGRFAFTLDPADVGAFKTPGLRYVALTAPYMHNGSIPTLGAAVDFELQHRGLQSNRPVALSASERDDLLAFLQALTGQSAAEAPEPDGPVANPAPQSAALR